MDTSDFDLDAVDRLLTTTKAVRRRLDLSRPVPRSVISECIRLATYAPSASNAQEWRWVVVDDVGLRRQVGELYRRCVEAPVTTMLAAKVAAGDEAGARVSRSVLYLAEHMVDVPAIVIACYDRAAATDRYARLLDPDRAPVAVEPAMFASILPAVWSFQLALRSRGLGSTLTTAHQADQPAMAEILGLPASWYQVALLPVAYTTGGDFRPSPRDPVEGVIHWNGL
jgi:nitroreductase